MSEVEGREDQAAATAAGDAGWISRWRAHRSDRRDIRADRRMRRRARRFGGASPDDAARQAESHAMSTGSTFGKGNPKP